MVVYIFETRAKLRGKTIEIDVTEAPDMLVNDVTGQVYRRILRSTAEPHYVPATVLNVEF